MVRFLVAFFGLLSWELLSLGSFIRGRVGAPFRFLLLLFCSVEDGRGQGVVGASDVSWSAVIKSTTIGVGNPKERTERENYERFVS